MHIYLNGQSTDDLPAELTVSDLVDRMNLVGKRIAVELDGEIVPRSKHKTTVILDGCRIEIVTAIGGG